MKLKLRDASFMFEYKDAILYLACIHLAPDGSNYWSIHANGIHIANIQEERTEQYVNQTRAKQVIEQAEKAVKINSGSGK